MLILVVFVKQVFSYCLYPDNPPDIAVKPVLDTQYQYSNILINGYKERKIDQV